MKQELEKLCDYNDTVIKNILLDMLSDKKKDTQFKNKLVAWLAVGMFASFLINAACAYNFISQYEFEREITILNDGSQGGEAIQSSNIVR